MIRFFFCHNDGCPHYGIARTRDGRYVTLPSAASGDGRCFCGDPLHIIPPEGGDE